ncbi:MAG: hypothetical protein LBL21_04600 [Rickettsiales bacterium]|jgi:hypothetical protein|nr:hypothetical protein [Rickettsiales bacterium]
MENIITMRVMKITPIANGVKLSGFRVADNEILKKYPIAFDFIPARHGMENFPRVGQDIQISPDKSAVNKIVCFSPTLPPGFFSWDKDRQDKFCREDMPRMAKQLDANANIAAAPAEIARALGISISRAAEVKQLYKPLEPRQLFQGGNPR